MLIIVTDQLSFLVKKSRKKSRGMEITRLKKPTTEIKTVTTGPVYKPTVYERPTSGGTMPANPNVATGELGTPTIPTGKLANVDGMQPSEVPMSIWLLIAGVASIVGAYLFSSKKSQGSLSMSDMMMMSMMSQGSKS